MLRCSAVVCTIISHALQNGHLLLSLLRTRQCVLLVYTSRAPKLRIMGVCMWAGINTLQSMAQTLLQEPGDSPRKKKVTSLPRDFTSSYGQGPRLLTLLRLYSRRNIYESNSTLKHKKLINFSGSVALETGLTLPCQLRKFFYIYCNSISVFLCVNTGTYQK